MWHQDTSASTSVFPPKLPRFSPSPLSKPFTSPPFNKQARMESSKSQPSDQPKTPEKIRRIDGQHLSPSWAVKTPKQISHPPRIASQRRHHSSGSSQLPEKLEMLRRIFNAMESALRLLRMRKSMPVFSRVRTMVECMTERRFAFGHLAQLKFVLPEEIVIKRVSLVDEKTQCVKRDLHVTLNHPMANDGKRKRGDGGNGSSLKELLRLRLLQFYETQPEGTEIPMALLPEPFNQLEEEPETPARKSNSLHGADYSSADTETRPKASSHLSLSFRKHFSCKEPRHASASTPIYAFSEPNFIGEDVRLEANLAMTTPCQESKYSRSVEAGNHFPERKGTPMKLASTPSKYMDSHTPALVPPKRSSMRPDKDSPSTSNMNVSLSCARVLNFDIPDEKATVELELSDTESNDLLDIVPENLLKLIKQKERTPDEQAMWRKTIAGVPKIFDRILYLFQCAKTSFIEQKELIIKLTEFHSDIVDESEIMEQLKLLREIIPEWISEKMSSSMSILYCINKTLSPDELRARIEKAA
ncbi:hypothetical protein Droror1_Dr00009235 [Drosera rotundifolia]